MATPFNILILSSALLLTTPRPSTADDNNILFTGETLATDDQLTYRDFTFVMQGDCNLVLYNNGGSPFQSNTHGNGKDCTLSFTENGRLAIRNQYNETIWRTPNYNSKKGDYVAVLRPDGEVAIYGGRVWKTVTRIPNEVGRWPRLTNLPMVKNVFFSGQVLYGGSKLWTRDYTFVMRADCDLALEKAGEGIIWHSETSGDGVNCFLRLNHFGQLSVIDDVYDTVWTSSAIRFDEGEYVLVLQYDGNAAVYGPKVWTTAGEIGTVTDE